MASFFCLTRLLVIFALKQMTPGQLITDEQIAAQWLEVYNSSVEEAYFNYVTAQWNYNTNLTDYNSQLAVNASNALAIFDQETYQNTTLFDWRNFDDENIKRLFWKISDIGTSVLEGDDLAKYNQLRADLKKAYSTAEVCNDTDCFGISPDLANILASSGDWDELLWVWKGWREATGKKMKAKYEKFVDLQNKAAKENHYADAGEYWRSDYETETFEADCLRLWEEAKPLYEQLHGYVRRKLKEQYAGREFPSSGHIPAHILGNMWAQSWLNLLDTVNPYPEYAPIDITPAMVQQGYDALRIFNLSDAFFKSLGLIEMPQEFWDHSMLVKPANRSVVCHASAWDFYNRKDFRIKQCTDITQEWLATTHHEMGHIQYFLQYKDLPVTYRDGANPGFHEAVGDVLILSVTTPEHLKKIGLLEEISPDREYDINFLMRQALEHLAFVPFGYLIDQWRWSVFKGETLPEDYNRKWWELRCKHQGVSPPVAREKDDFDPGAKYHIPNNTPYIRYFVSFILQFQFHQALCDAAGYNGSLHRCDIYDSKDAGIKLGNMLRLGSSKPWPEAMEAITGQREMSAAPLLKFFQPLHDWLTEQNEGYDIGWDDECPDGSFVEETTTTPSSGTTTDSGLRIGMNIILAILATYRITCTFL